MSEALSAGGYLGKLLRVDLTDGTCQPEDVSVAVLKKYIGGTGLGIYLLYTEVPQGVSPFSGENKLIFTTGPLTGTLVPGSGTFAVVSKSPLTGYAASAQANGHFGARLKSAGFDAIVVQGKASENVYLLIAEGSAQLLPAEFLDGLGTMKTDEILRARHGEKGVDHRISITSIGPAGENRVKYAAICSDRGHMASSGGLGAVMGSKSLKAILVQGGGAVPIHSDNIDDFKNAVATWRTEAAATGLGKTIHEKGTLGLFKSYQEKGWVPVKNLTTNKISEEDMQQYDWAYLRNELFQKVSRSCHACTFTHCHSIRVTKGRYKGLVTEEPEYEILAGFGPNWGISDPGAIAMFNWLNDDLGMDAKEVSFLISMLMEGAERGFISPNDLDGIDLSWGYIDGIIELLQKISRREGIGNYLADGVKRTAEHLGDNFQKMAVYVKQGNAPHIHDLRTRWGTFFTQVISNTGSNEGIDLTSRANPELGIDQATSNPDTYLAKAQALTGPKRQFEECLVFCYFQSCSLKHMVHTLNVLTGLSYTIDDCLQVGERVINLLRLYNIREGLTEKDDSYSYRLGQSPQDGPGKGKSMNLTFNEIRGAYYHEMGWNNKGVPLPSTLERLDLKSEKRIKCHID